MPTTRRFPWLMAIVAGLVAAGASVAVGGGDASAATCAALDPFAPAWSTAYLASWSGQHLAAAVEDEATGCSFHLGATDAFPTASTAKAQIMGAELLSFQDGGATSLDGNTAALLDAMIRYSDNDSATALYEDLGGAAALQSYGRRLGMVTTDNASFSWGGDATTPDDQIRLLRTLLVGGGALNDTWVAVARSYMGAVDPAQAWGVSAGVPAASTVWLKNGWLYNDGTDWGPADAWRVNSIGAVQLPNGRRYLVAVYGNTWSLMGDGITAIETLSAHVATVLAAPRNHGETAVAATALAATDAGSVFSATAPTRLLDTRSTGAPVAADGEVAVDVGIGTGGVVPTAVAVNITAVDASSAGYVTAYADGTARPLASTLNPQPGRAVPNLAIVPVGADGRIRLYTSRPTQLVVDLLGRWTPHAGAATAGRYQAVTPSRLLDTRSQGPALAAGAVVTVPVRGRNGLPAAGVAAVVVNVTVTDSAAPGYWTVWPSGTPRPLASTLNTGTGETIANTTVVPVGGDGAIQVYAQAGGQLVIDVVGWFTDATAPAATAGRLVTLARPVRAADTRFGDGDVDRLLPASTVTLTATGVPTDATAVAAVVTYTDPRADGYVTTYGAGASRPLASTTNPSTRLNTWANSTITGVTDARLDAYSLGSTELIIDVTGWFTP